MNGNNIEAARLPSRGLRPATRPATQAPDGATRSRLATLVLLVLTFALNATAILVRSRMRRHLSRSHG
jgi:hypothetical protein